MTGRILVVDDVATNRIVLKVKLSASQYEIEQCSTFEEAEDRLATHRPELIVIDHAGEEENCIDFCKSLRADPDRTSIPILVLSSNCSTKLKTGLLLAGVEEVLAKPTNEALLLARIRSLLRARTEAAEYTMRDDAKQALGLAEAPSPFIKPSLVGIVAEDSHISRLWADALTGKKGLFCTHLDQRRIFAAHNVARVPDVFLIDGTRGDNTTVLRLLSELRSRKNTRHSSIILVASDTDPDLAAMALDLGADDLLFDGFSTHELRIRLTTQVNLKQSRDRMRSGLRDGIAAAVTDPLTGLHNRRYAMPHLGTMVEASNRSERQIAVLVIDIDHFKEINDTYGHKAGDRVLAEVAGRLKSNLRGVDLIARIGGEEFLVALPDMDEERALVAADRLCATIHDQPFAVEQGRVTPVTVSIGLAISRTGAMQSDAEDLIRRADIALYTSKASGRNMVSMHNVAAA